MTSVARKAAWATSSAGGVGVADVLRGADHDAPRDELGVLAGVEHPREPVEHGVGVGAAHGLDERRDDIVVHVARLVVGQAAAGVGLEDVLGGDDERRAVVLLTRRGVHHLGGQLERGERRAAVAAGQGHDLVLRLGREHKGAREAALVGHGAAQQLADGVVVEGGELHDAAAADEGGVDLEVGVLGRGAHEHDGAVLHAWSRASCWPRLKRWISSTKRMVRRPSESRRLRAASISRRRSLTVPVTALTSTNSACVVWAMMRASVVLPVPAGP